MSAAKDHTRISGPGTLPSHQYLGAVWEFVGDAIALSDPQGTVLAANPAYLKLYGYSAEEVIGQNFAIIFPENVREWANQEYQKTFADPLIAPAVESVIRRKDDTERVVEARYNFVVEDGKRTAMISIVRDITDQKRAEAQFRSLVDGNVIGILRADMQHILDANDAFLQMIGYAREDLVEGKIKWREITPPEWLPADEQAIQELLGRGAATPYEKEYFRKDGERLPILIGETLLTRSPATWMCFVLDLTDRKRAEAKEREARLDSEQAVLDRDRLLSIVAHDLRNPLTTIYGTAQILARRLQGNREFDREQLERMAGQIKMMAVRMNSIIEEILDFSKLQAGVPLPLSNRSTDLVRLVQTAADECRRNHPHHEVLISSAVPSLVADWDPSRLERVFANLLDNAVKYSPERSTIAVEIETRDGGEGRQGSSGWAMVTVKDKGVGIPAEDLASIFEWYKRGSNTENWTTGTGIGLAGARQVVEQYGGTITVESVEGQGSAFTVSLPVTTGA